MVPLLHVATLLCTLKGDATCVNGSLDKYLEKWFRYLFYSTRFLNYEVKTFLNG